MDLRMVIGNHLMFRPFYLLTKGGIFEIVNYHLTH